MYPKIFLKSNRAKNILARHPWVFSGAIDKKEPVPDGDLCQVLVQGTFLGVGMYHSQTDIAVRIISWEDVVIDEKFFYEKFQNLRNKKELFLPPETNAYRLCFAESDGVPGLIIDKYSDVLVVQLHTLGAEKLMNFWLPALIRVFSPKGIFLKISEHSAKKENISLFPQTLFGEVPREVIIQENGFSFLVPIQDGQKTGFFLDQRENRMSILPYIKNKTVLNCFSYTGGFSVYAGKGGAKKVTSVDISEFAIQIAQKNFSLNHLFPEDHIFQVEDVFSFLKKAPSDFYDCIILDPPSFARNRSDLKSAIKAYITLNSEALKKLPKNGIFVSASCTAHVSEELFLNILHQSANNAGGSLQMIHRGNQPFDHGYNIHFPEGRYLKFFIFLKD